MLPACLPTFALNCLKYLSHFIKMKNMNSRCVCKTDLLQTKPGFVVGLFNHVRTLMFGVWFLMHIDLSLMFCV